MKICIFAHTFPRFKTDTPAAFMEGLCEGISMVGNEVVALVPYDQQINRKKNDQSYKFKSFKYIYPNKLHLLGYSRTMESDRKLRNIVYLLAPFYYFFGFWALLRLVKKEKVDIINAHWIIPGGFIGALVSLVSGIPLVITVAGSDVYLASKNKLYRILAMIAAFIAKEIVGGGSPMWTQDLVNLGINKQKTGHTIIYGVNPKQYYPDASNTKELRKKLGISKDDIVVLAVGRLVYKKGFHVFINAIPDVIKNNKNVKFIIVGDGDQKLELQSLIQKLKINNFVIMPGTILRNELLIYYNLCDIYVSTSVRDKDGNLDDQSIALVEAMACDKPVIATDLSGNRLVVKEEKNGYLFKMGDSKELAKKISVLVGNKKIRKKFGQEGLALSRSDFSVKAVGQAYTALFKDIIKK